MKIFGILILSLLSGLLAAGISIAWGGSFWDAVVNYFLIGTATTLFGVAVVAIRVMETDQSKSKPMIGPEAAASK